MSDETHPGIEKVSNFVSLKKSKNLSKLYNEGYLYIKNLIDDRQCKCLIDDLNDLRGVYPYHIEESKSFPGIFRSPFLNSNNFRDLLLNKTIHNYLNQIFPTNYQLHLSRCVENKRSKIAATAEWHRDIPYLHTPSKFPLSISVLTFLSSCSDIQIEILLESHNQKFYNFDESEVLRLNPKPGDAILFDSNLMHRTLPTEETVAYNLYMYSSPVIKPIVDYSSEEIVKKIKSNDYKLKEVLDNLGYDFLIPKDDLEYVNKKRYYDDFKKLKSRNN